MAVNLNDLARVELVDKLAAKVAAKLNTLTDTTFKAAKVDGNSLKFYTSTDTTGQAAETIDIPAEQFLDQASTSFVPNFQFSALLYDGASNPNLDGKAVLVLGLKTKSNDGKSASISYSFVDVSRLVDTYTASDTSVTVTNYKIKANISVDAGNTLKLKSNGLYAAGVTDTATTTAAGLMSAADKTKVNNLDVELSKKLDSDTTAVKAAKLETARSLKVSLSSSAAQTFDGSADATQIGVTGTLPVANGGTGKTNLSEVTVGKATQLETARNIQTNLGSTTAGSFNGTASVSAGVTGTLGIANGGTGQTTAAGVRNALGLGNTTGALPVANGGTGKTNLNDVTVGAANKDGAGNVITDTYVTKTAFEETIDNIRRWRKIPIYGYRIDKNEADPDARVEYILDAAGMTPAHMDFATGVFDYGSWGDVWFVKGNKPCMLKYDGTVDYYLDPDDYTKKADGTASDVANIDYGGNAMAQIPLCWVYRYEDENYYYEIVSPEKVDDNFKAYAHTDASGNIKPYFYHALFEASGNATKLRSFSGQTVIQFVTHSEQFNAAKANGTGWLTQTWSQQELIRTLLVLLGKSTNTQAVFGYGNAQNIQGASGLLPTGTLTNKGQFYGSSKNNQQIKAFHIEGLWGNQWQFILGVLQRGGKIFAKMTPEGTGYSLSDYSKYVDTGITIPNSNGPAFFNKMACSEYGMFPIAIGGSDSTYFCDIGFFSVSKDITRLVMKSAAVNYETFQVGMFCLNLNNQPSDSGYNLGSAISYV